MSFFSTSDNQPIVSTGEFESQTNLEPIPAGTTVTCSIEEAVWDEYQGEWTIKLTWVVLDGEYKNRKIFHKLRVEDADAAKADKAKKMLAAIDTNCGGTLQRAGGKPNDNDLAALTNRPMNIRLMVWDIDGKSGNWVSAVGSANGAKQTPQAPVQPKQAPVQQQQQAPGPLDDNIDIPF